MEIFCVRRIALDSLLDVARYLSLIHHEMCSEFPTGEMLSNTWSKTVLCVSHPDTSAGDLA